MNSDKCMFNRTCKNKGSVACDNLCYPFVMLHGRNGESGFWATTGVPKKYKNCLIGNLPIKEDNEKIYTTVLKYVKDIGKFVDEKGAGLFLYSIPNKENPFGTGTGKTTTAITILNEYVIYAVRKHLKGEEELKRNPALFVKSSELQNKYNAQFRGSFELQQEASNIFYKYKDRMKKVPLLVLDDIAIRDTTEAFKNELFEIIDYRATEGLTTIYTSNYPLEKLVEFLGERIVSRIDGMCIVKFGFKGNDNRKGGLW